MNNFSRRQLANFAVEQLLDGKKPSLISRQLAAALIADKRVKETQLLIDDIAEELERRGLLAKVTVTSATKLSANLKASLSAQIKRAAKVTEVSLNEQVDNSVIGGIKVETSAHAWDKTIARRLSEIKGGI